MQNPFKQITTWFSEKFSGTNNSQNSVKTHQYNIATKLQKATSALIAKQTKEGNEKAREYAYQDLPSADQKSLTPYESGLKASFSGLWQKVAEMTSQPIAKLEALISSLTKQIERVTSKENKFQDVLLDNAQSDSKNQEDLINVSHTEKSTPLKDQLKEKFKLRKVYQLQEDLIPVETISKKQLGLLVCLLLAMVFGESYLNYPVWEFVLRKGIFATWVVTLVFSTAIAYGCHFIGKNLSVLLEPKNFKKKFFLYSSFLVLAVIFYFMGEYRQQYILQLDPTAFTAQPWQFMILNLMICAVVSYSSFQFSKYNKENKKRRADLTATIKEIDSEIKKLEQTLGTLDKMQAQNLGGVSSGFSQKVDSIDKKSEDLYQKLAQAQMDLAELQAFEIAEKAQINEAFLGCLQTFRNTVFTLRPTKITPSYWSDPISLSGESKTSIRTKQSSNGSTLNKWITTASIFILSVGLFSCGSPQAESQAVSLILDETDSSFVHSYPTSEQILNTLYPVSKGIIIGALDISITSISDVSANPVDRLNLTLSSSNDNQFNREAQSKRFKLRLDSVLTQYSKTKSWLERSCVYRQICSTTSELQKSCSDRKSLFIVSDLLELSDDVGNFYDPKFPTINSNFSVEKVINKMKRARSFPSAEGIDVTIICLPNRQNDLSVIKAQSIYKKLFQDAGAASITFKTNL